MPVNIDITGKHYNNLTAIRFDHHNHDSRQSHQYWLFRCDCGEYIVARKNSVVNGATKSCPKCVKNKHIKEAMAKYLKYTGKKFNKLTVNNVTYVNKTVKFLCTCECGNITLASAASVIAGRWQSCSCSHPGNLIKEIDRIGIKEHLQRAGVFQHAQVNNLRNDKLFKNNKSGYRGVTYITQTNRWIAQITVGGVHHIKSCKTLEEAVAAREELYIKHTTGIIHSYDALRKAKKAQAAKDTTK